MWAVLPGSAAIRRNVDIGIFSPLNISGLQGWYKSDAITGLNDGDALTTWLDSSGNGNSASQSTVANKPLYKTAIQNGLPVVRFDGSNDFLDIASGLGLTTASGATIFAVYSCSAATDNGLIDTSNTNPGTVNTGLGITRLHSFSDTFFARAGSSANDITVASDTVVTMRIIRYRHVQATRELWWNGVSKGTNSNSVSIGTQQTAVIGRWFGGNSYPLSGDIAEILVYNASLSDAQCTQIETYLTSKWGL